MPPISSTIPYENLLIEVRPNLQSVNVFLQLKHNSKVQVSLREDSFILNIDGKDHAIPSLNFQIIPSSLSNLKIEEDHLSFRFTTQSVHKNFGSFKSEVLELSDNTIRNSEECFLRQNLNYKILCKNCLHPISTNFKTNRVLPLPSDTSEQNDWFCHAPACAKVTNLNPQKDDIFYSECYVHVNTENCVELKTLGSVLHCMKCCNWLGLIQNEETNRLWFNTVQFQSETEEYKTDPLMDAFKTISSLLAEPLLTSSKIMLTTQISDEEVNNLLLWVLEKNLTVGMYKDNKWETLKLAKVFFTSVDSDNDLVMQWKQDVGVSCVSVSKNMIVDLINHLSEMKKYIPKEYSRVMGFSISYICMYNAIK